MREAISMCEVDPKVPFMTASREQSHGQQEHEV